VGDRVEKLVREIFDESVRVKENFLQDNLGLLIEVALVLSQVLRGGNKILFFGNGGSAADAQHLAAEFVNRYLVDRPPLAALALTTDTSVLTAISNDFSYDEIFSKQIRALGANGDAAVGISTSGCSPNVLRGLEAATAKGMITVGLGGPPESPMSRCCRFYFSVHGGKTPRLQETHIVIGHTLVELIDNTLFPAGESR
jgi:D-sedoheptulose 7-phosphate isomerase